MAAVVEKQFVWRFVDEVSAGLRQAQSVMEQTLEVFRSAGAIANESAKGFNDFGTDAQSSATKVNEAMNKCQSDINKVKESINGLPKEKTTDIETKANMSGIEKAEQGIKRVPAEKTTDIQTKANMNGVEKAEEGIKKVPSEKITDINAKANSDGIIKFREELDKTPKERVADLLAKAKGEETISSFKKQVDEVPSEKTTVLKANPTGESKIKSFGETLKGTALGMGVYNAAMQAGTVVSEQFSSAINRYDQLQRFPRILEDMGSSAKDANASVKILSNGIDGLPTSLDQMETSAQRFMPITNNAKLAAKSAVALNDALISSGATAQDASDGLKEWTEMLDEGKPKMMQWQELTRVMSPALQKVAKSFGIASGSTSELYKKLQSGQITMQQLNQHMLQLDKGTRGFANTAHDATAGIGTAFDNLKIRLTKALADAVGGFNDFVKIISGNSIAQNINNLSSNFSNLGKKVSSVFVSIGNILKPLTPAFQALGSIIVNVFKGALNPIQDIGSAISDMYKKAKDSGAINTLSKGLQDIAKHKSELEGVGKAVTGVIATIAGAKALSSTFSMISKGISAFSTLGKAASSIKSFQGALAILQFGLKNLVSALGGIPGIITIVVGAFVTLYNVSPKFRKFVNDIVKNVESFAKNFVKKFKDALDNVGKFFKGDLGWQKGLEKNLNKIGDTFSKAVKPWAKPVENAIKSIGSYIGNNVKGWGKNISSCLSSIGKTFDSWGKTISKNVNSAMNNVKKIISPILQAIQKDWENRWDAISKFVTNIFKSMSTFVQKHMSNIKSIIQSVTKIISTIWNTVWKEIENVFKLVWDLMFHQSKVIDDIKNIISTGVKGIQTIWQNVWNIIKNYFSMIWDGIKDIANSAINGVKNIISNVTHGIKDIWNDIWNGIRDYVDLVWKSIKHNVSSAINTVHDTLSNVLGKIKDTWNSLWQSMGDFFGNIWKDIKKYAQDGINGVINVINAGIDGIDTVWKFFTGHETSIHHLKPVHFSQGGIVDRHLSMVNDGAGENWKELIETPSGELMMSDQRNAVLPLEPGTRVYNGDETKAIMSALGVDHYANGGVVGDVIDWGSHELSDLGSWIKDKWDAITKFLKHPLENTEAIINKAITDPLKKIGNSNFVELGKGVFNKLTKPISDWFKKGLQQVKDEHDAQSADLDSNSTSPQATGNHKHWVEQAGIPMKYWDDVNYIVSHESGWNPHATNPSSGAYGLPQSLPASKMAAAGKDWRDNPITQLKWMYSYVNATYGGFPQAHAFWESHHAYKNGGQITGPDLALVGDNPEQEEFIINPYAPSARPLLRQAIDRTESVQPKSQDDVSNTNDDNQIGKRIIELLEMILNKESYVNLEDAGQRLRSNDAQSLRMTNMQRGV